MFMYFFFFNDTATTEIYTLSLHDALPISSRVSAPARRPRRRAHERARRRQRRSGRHLRDRPVDHPRGDVLGVQDRKSTRLNSSHANISYAVFCLKKKKNKNTSVQYYNSYI